MLAHGHLVASHSVRLYGRRYPGGASKTRDSLWVSGLRLCGDLNVAGQAPYLSVTLSIQPRFLLRTVCAQNWQVGCVSCEFEF